MTDLISRADAIEAVAQQWLFEASVGNPYVNDDDIGEYRKLAEELFEDVPSADAVSRKFYEDAVKANIGIVIENRKLKEQIESADAEPKWNCTANFIAEQLERLRNMTDEEKWEFFKRFFEIKGGDDE